MKPIHEETWYVEFGSIMVQAGDVPGGDDFLMQYGGKAGRAERVRLASVAPDMARALTTLVALLGEDPVFTDPSEADCYAALHHAQDALRKAGVISTQLPAAPPENQP